MEYLVRLAFWGLAEYAGWMVMQRKRRIGLALKMDADSVEILGGAVMAVASVFVMYQIFLLAFQICRPHR